jgi:hypothetical protein
LESPKKSLQQFSATWSGPLQQNHLSSSAWRTTTTRESSAWTTTTNTTEAGGLEENWTNSCRVDLNEYESDATTARKSSAWRTTTKTTEAGWLEENWTNSCRDDLDKYESDDGIEILSEVGSVFVGTPSGSSSETLTTATSSEDGSGEGPKIEGPEIALEDAAKSKHLPKYGSRAKLRPETNEWT